MGFDAGVFHQIAYVTNDVDEAVRLYAREHGVPKFLQMDITLDAIVRGRPSEIMLRIALANIRGVQIELIQPIAGDYGLYAEALEDCSGLALRFHHVASCVTGPRGTWHDLRERLMSSRHVVLDGESGDDVAYLYTDERDTLGHHVEYLWFTAEQFLQAQAGVPTF